MAPAEDRMPLGIDDDPILHLDSMVDSSSTSRVQETGLQRSYRCDAWAARSCWTSKFETNQALPPLQIGEGRIFFEGKSQGREAVDGRDQFIRRKAAKAVFDFGADGRRSELSHLTLASRAARTW